MTRFVAIRKVESNEGAARSSEEKRAAAVRNPLSNEKAGKRSQGEFTENTNAAQM